MWRNAVCLLVSAVMWTLIQAGPAYSFNPNTDPGLAGWWKLDDATGTTAVDSSPAGGHDGTLTNGPVWVAGHLGGALQFDGTDDYVDSGWSENLSTWTISCWVTSPAAPSSTGSPSGPLHRENNYQFNWNHSNGGNWPASVATNVGAWTPARLGTLSANTWYFIAGTFDGTDLKAYTDGELITTVALSGTPASDTNTMKLGRHAANTQYFGGTVDDARVYNRALTQEEIQQVMKGGVNAGLAGTPSPEDGGTDVPRDVVLTWVSGQYAGTHDVYFGTTFEDVNAASTTAPGSLLVSRGQTGTSYDPTGLLDFGQTYYWRVDEVNATPDKAIYRGSTWSFKAETYGYAVRPVKATASSQLNVQTGPDKTIDGSGLDALDEHSTSTSHMWLSKKNVTPIWIQYEFDTVYKLYQMWVWNSNQAVEPDVGFGADEVTIATSLDGTTWTVLDGVAEFAQASGEPNYTHNTTVDFGGVQAKYVKITINSNWAGTAKQSGLSEVRFFYIPTKAYGPTPAAGATGVAIDGTLSWRPGREAAKHQVYLGEDLNALSAVATVTTHSLGLASLGLQYGKTYYWRVDEVNDAATPSSWEGNVWTFSIPDRFVVDDFEGYANKCNRIFWAWADGLGNNGSEDCGVGATPGNGSGSTVGNATTPWAEQAIVFDGVQSMPFFYDNTSGAGYSEATRTFGTAQNWTAGGVKTLVLYFCGTSDNGAGQLYVKINNVKVEYKGNAAAVTLAMWKQWNIDLSSVSGLQSVKTLTIGISGSGKGVLYIDDILLYRLAPAVVVPADPGTANLQGYYPMDGSVNDSSGHGRNGTITGNQAYADAPSGRGKAIQLNGTNDYVELPIGTLVSTLASTTITAWVNFTYGSGSYERVFDFGTGSTNYMFLSAHQAGTTPEIFGILTTGGTEARCTPSRPMGTGWHHLAVVMDSATMSMALYLDGTVVATNTTTMLPKDLGKTTQNWLGRSQFTADAYYTGMLDDLRIYNRALSAGEVAYLAGARP